MKKNNSGETSLNKYSRRRFLRTVSATTAGLLAAPYISSTNIFAYGHEENSSYLTKVAITKADNYERTFVKQKVQYLFKMIDGITDIVKPGNKVGIKINLTGGGGLPLNMWTNPEVLRAVGELIIDCGVNANDIYIVESLWNDSSYNNYGYLDIQKSLGAQMINLNNHIPYDDFVDVPVGDKKFYYSSFKLNKILQDIDVYISIPKMKQHYEAGVTCSLKNQIGIAPRQLYTIPTDSGRRGALHSETGGSSTTHLPQSICDLNMARPVNLAVIDGIINARGGEGNWNPTFTPAADHILLAGKDPVAADSVAAYFMSNDPQAAKLQLPGGGQCDNYLDMLHQKGIGTNQMNEIKIVGDGSSLITSVIPKYNVVIPGNIKLLQNYPNPFNPATIIRFYLPRSEYACLIIYNINGREIETLVKGVVPAGLHEFHWAPNGRACGVYLYKLMAGSFSEVKKMIYQK